MTRTHGNIIYRNRVVWIQKKKDGWFASVRDEDLVFDATSGPWPSAEMAWPSAEMAEDKLTDALESLFKCEEGKWPAKTSSKPPDSVSGHDTLTSVPS